MKKIVLICLLAGFCLLPVPLGARDREREINAILDAAEGVFMAMQAKDYPRVWTGLSKRSRDTIAGEVSKAAKTASLTRDAAADDFSQGGHLAKAYWDAYLKNFDPAMVLDESRWEMGKIREQRAEISITHKKARKAVTLYMVKEDGMWRTGLTESFWSRK